MGMCIELRASTSPSLLHSLHVKHCASRRHSNKVVVMGFSIGTISDATYIGLGVFFSILCAAFVGIRCTVAFQQYRKLLVDDYLSIIGFVLNITLYVYNEYQFKSFFEPAPTLGVSIKKALVIPILATFTLWSSKAPVLLLYIRLFGVKTWMRYASYITLVISFLGFAGPALPALIQCRPFDTPYTIPKWTRCSASTFLSGFGQGATSITIDLVILLLPLHPIYSLNLPLRRRIGLGLVFLTGIVGLVASALSFAFRLHLLLGGRTNVGSIHTTQLLQFIECAIALIVGSVPAASGFWNRNVVPSEFYHSIGSMGSRLRIASSSLLFKHGPRSDLTYRADSKRERLSRVDSITSPNSGGVYIHMESRSASGDEFRTS
ncbi:hypothetical protein GGR57DRAFT_475445 [Xylariaceae sp. FL1272]|nr:hypothetical protein GGR57DRAFT_475445 [Xylariaceae sp. FL1272]